MSEIKNLAQKYTPWLLILLFAVAYLLPLNNRMLWIPDESRYAEISREMIQRGDWIVPHLLGLHYFEKPIAGYWLNSLSQLLFGESHFAVRFASALSAGLTAWLIFWFSQRLFNSQKKAIAAAVCYLSFILVYAIGTYSVLDSMVTLWLDLTLVCFYVSLQASTTRQKLTGYALMGVAAGLGFLTKGFISLAVPVIVALPYLFYRRQLHELRYLWIALLTLLLVSLPWAIAIHLRAPDSWHYFFWVEHIQRFSGADAQHKAPFWYYLPILIAGCLPWLGLAPAALKQSWRTTSIRPVVMFLLFWLLIPFLFFSIAKGKLPTYILPCFAPLAILLGYGITELLAEKRWRVIRQNAWVNMAFGGLLLVAVLLLGSGIMGKQPLYLANDHVALALAVLCFAGWLVAGWFSYRKPAQSLYLTALCPLVLGLLLGWSLPTSLINSKLPEAFIAQHQQELDSSRFVFSNDVGLAVSLGWQLKRDDIQLYGADGELAYGLADSSQTDKRVKTEDFPAWLNSARQQGNVSVVTRNKPGELPKALPAADQMIAQQNFTLLYYRQAISTDKAENSAGDSTGNKHE
ncbi:MAG: lipid IV(A) 4-amino-4-deoxy-L-arabinosyltransferase [Tolumonas sp.]|nr:lipid IV(A) 4-amino-4-deoxy-L-arabinosyltransferase [Tolumonas sp.]